LSIQRAKKVSLKESKGLKALENMLEGTLNKNGLYQVENNMDGNCLFESLSLLLFGTAKRHTQVRSQVVDFIKKCRTEYEDQISRVQKERRNNGLESDLLPGQDDFSQYVDAMSRSKPAKWGDEFCVSAAARVYNVIIKVFTDSSPNCITYLPLEEENAFQKTIIHLSNIDNRHFRAAMPILNEQSASSSHWTPEKAIPPVPKCQLFMNLSSTQLSKCYGQRGN
jgi:hypothetical protein